MATSRTVAGFEILREIARGGMGCVLAARDLTLDRDVALKVLLPGASEDRFVREAKITARLPHPGIPPVYALGWFTDGSPFLAMKLIEGQTLAMELKTANRPRLLQVFTQVCQAVGFAHSRGVIHRDLKPTNIMVGAFGEVQVMDWGLATDQPRRTSPEESTAPSTVAAVSQFETETIIDSGESTDERTQPGAVMGTPAYMAPEQARGEVLGTQADVFALGGILCVLLTGRPPFAGKNAVEIVQVAASGNLVDANSHLDTCGADAELINLCRRCLSPDPLTRPVDGQAVADEMNSYLNNVQERLHLAERERAVAITREAEGRKRRLAYIALTAAVLMVLLGSGAFVLWENEQARINSERLARNREVVTELLNQGHVALRSGDIGRAQAAINEASRRSNEGGADGQGDRFVRLTTDLNLLNDLYAIEQFRWTPIKQTLPESTILVQRYRETLPPFGTADSTVDAATKWVSDSVIADRIVTAMDWLLMESGPLKTNQQPPELVATKSQQPSAPEFEPEKVHAVLRRVDSDPFRNAVRDSFLSGDFAALRSLAEQSVALEQPPGFLAVFGTCTAIDANVRHQILELAINRNPENLSLLMALGHGVPELQNGSVTEQLRWFQAAAAAVPDSPAAYINMGNALALSNQFDTAINCYQKAVELRPTDPVPSFLLGDLLKKRGRFTESFLAIQQSYYAGLSQLNTQIVSDDQVRQAELMLEMDNRMEAFLSREFHPESVEERVALAEVCLIRNQHQAAARLYAAAFELTPELVEAPKSDHRYNAIRAVALATGVGGEDVNRIEDGEKDQLHLLSLKWLRVEFTVLQKQHENSSGADRARVDATLRNWQDNDDFRSIRDISALAQFSPATQQAFTQFWAEVDTVLRTSENEPDKS
ncbi:MAG: protein kinase [Planctomyces sp.]|nr:protein kinase [Planctomyces sp.]